MKGSRPKRKSALTAVSVNSASDSQHRPAEAKAPKRVPGKPAIASAGADSTNPIRENAATRLAARRAHLRLVEDDDKPKADLELDDEPKPDDDKPDDDELDDEPDDDELDDEPKPKRSRIGEWLGSKVPALVVEGCQLHIRSCGREPEEPEDDLEAMFQEQFSESGAGKGLAQLLGFLDRHPWVQMLIIVALLYLSMRWGAKVIPKSDKPETKTLETSSSASASVKEPCAKPEPSATKPAATPATADNTRQPVDAPKDVGMFAGFSRPTDTSAGDGGRA